MKRIALTLILCAGASVASAAGLTPAEIKKIDGFVEAFRTKNQVPGLTMAVVRDGQLAWSKGYGKADLENDVPATTATEYRAGSMGKPMTAIGAVRLVEEGKLDLDADIRGTCPAFPAKPWRITARHLLQHTSGIRHYGGPRDAIEQYDTHYYSSVSEALAPFKDDSLKFEPGTKHLYSTYGYDVLGCVMEGAAGIPFLDVMKTRVWDPAGMKSTMGDDPAVLIPHRAAGYSLDGGKLRRARMADLSNRMPAGGYLTTADDLARFVVAVLDHRLVKAETFQQMVTPLKLPSGEAVAYGMGWGLELEPWHEDTYLFHGGSTPGGGGFFAVMPKHRCAVMFVANLEDIPGQARGELIEDVLRLVLGFKPRQP